MEIQQKIIKNKVGLINLAQELGNVSKACKIMGFSRDTFYRYKEAFDTGGVDALLEKSRKKPNLRNRMDQSIEKRILEFAFEYPAYGQFRVSNELRKEGISVSSGGVRGVWQRHNLTTMKLRLAALEKRVAEEGLILTEAQVIAMEKKKDEEIASGEIETHHPGYFGSQDTYYVGYIKGVGKIYQQTFVDTYSKVAFAKLYLMKTALTAADLLNDKVLPFFEQHKMCILRMLTDRGTEYCGKADEHDYQLYLALNDIDHSKTKVKSPQQNGICERFHRTIQNEFYAVAFRKKIYKDLKELQQDLDQWIDFYNQERTHQGKMCNGRTPLQTLLDDQHLFTDKVDNLNQIGQ